jgi:hypothetical protein
MNNIKATAFPIPVCLDYCRYQILVVLHLYPVFQQSYVVLFVLDFVLIIYMSLL